MLGTFSHEESQIFGKIDTWKFSGHFGVKLWVAEVVFLKQELIRSVPGGRKQATIENEENKIFLQFYEPLRSDPRIEIEVLLVG